jgi:hypothetical protein
MTKLEEKLIELGYDGLYVSLNKVIWYKYPTKFTIIQLTVESGKIIEVEYGERFRKIPKYQTMMEITINQLQKDLEVLKEYE